MKPTVCIGFSEALAAPEVAWSLLDAGFAVTVLARRRRNSSLRHSDHVEVIEITPPEEDLAAAQADIVRTLASKVSSAGLRGVLFPLDDVALWLFTRLECPAGWVLAGPPDSAVGFAFDKAMQMASARAAGLNVLPTLVANTVSEVLDADLQLPLILRPAYAVLARGGHLLKGRNWICATRAELDQAMNAWAGAWPMMVQPFIQGHGEGVFGLATDHGVLGWSGHRRLRMMNPHGSGSSACISQSVDADARLAVEQLIWAQGWRGLFMVELLRDHSGVLWFVEFNGRPWGSLALARRQGLEYPACAARIALEPNAPVHLELKAQHPVICRNVGREIMHLLFVLRGPKSRAFGDWPPFWRTVWDLVRIGRHQCFYNWRRNDLKVFFLMGGIPSATTCGSPGGKPA